MRLPSSVYGYVVINYSWSLILNMNGYLAAWFYKFHVLEKQKLIKTKQLDRPLISCKLDLATTKKSKYFEASRKYLRLCRWIFLKFLHLPEISVKYYNIECFFFQNYDFWFILNRLQENWKNLSVLGSKERKTSLMYMETSFT